MSSCWSLIVMVVCVSKFLGTVTISGVWQMGSLGVGPFNLGGMIKPLGPVGLGRDLSTLLEGSEARFERLETRGTDRVSLGFWWQGLRFGFRFTFGDRLSCCKEFSHFPQTATQGQVVMFGKTQGYCQHALQSLVVCWEGLCQGNHCTCILYLVRHCTASACACAWVHLQLFGESEFHQAEQRVA